MALFVASIDFGTTYSAWASSSRTEYVRDPTKILAKNWQGGSLISSKGKLAVSYLLNLHRILERKHNSGK